MSKVPACVGGLRGERKPSANTFLMTAFAVSVLAIACFVLVSDSDESDAAYASSVWVNGVEVTPSQSYSVSNGVQNATASYDSSTGTLMLTHFYSRTVTYSNTHQFDGSSYASIYADGDLNIVFDGSYSHNSYMSGSSIVFAATNFGGNTPNKTYGIYADGNLSITASGINTRIINQISFTPGGATTETAGIMANGTVTLKSIPVKFCATGGTTSYGNDVEDKTTFMSYGIKGTDVTIQYCADIVASTSDFIAPECGRGLVKSYGIWCTRNLNVKGDGTKATIKATSGDIDATYYCNGAYQIETAGIYCESKLNLDTRSTKMTVKAYGGDVYMDEDYPGYISSKGATSYGIRCGSMYCDTTVEAYGGTVFLPVIQDYGHSYGIFTGSFEGNGANLDVASSDAAVYSCGFYCREFDTGYNSTFYIEGGFVALTGEGTYAYGMRVDGTLIARSGSVLESYGGVVCYEQYTAGIYADNIALYGDARVTGYGGDTYNQYRSDTNYQTIPFLVQTGSTGNSFGVYIWDGSIYVEEDAVLTGVGGTIHSGKYLSIIRYTAGIYSYISLSISGPGQVVGIGGNTDYGRDRDMHIDYSFGIQCSTNLTIDGTRVTATGGNVCTMNNPDRIYANGAVSGGLYAKSLTVTGGADITATGGRHSAYATHPSSSPIYNDSIGVQIYNGSLSIGGGSVLRASATEGGALRLVGMRINGGITIDGNSQVIVEVPEAWNPSNGKLTTQDKLSKGSYGIYFMSNADTADVTVTSGTLIIDSCTRAVVTEYDSNTISAPQITYGDFSNLNFSNAADSVTMSTISYNPYVQASSRTYTLSFDKNGGAGGSMAAMTGQFGSTRLPSCDFDPQPGMTFKCWCTTSDGTGAQRASGYFPVLEDTTLYAIWEDRTYHVYLYPNGGEGSTQWVDLGYNASYTLPENEFTAPSHATFKCWSISSVEYSPGDVITITEDKFAYAIWEYEKVPVTFSSNGGSGSMDAMQVDWGHDFYLPDNAFTAPEHMQFKCWLVDGVEMNPYTIVEQVEEPVTVSAVWEYLVYTIRFLDDSYNEIQVLQLIYNQKPAFTGESPSREANAQYTYTFAGWSQDSGQTSGAASDDLPLVAGDTTYYPAFAKTVNTYRVTWKSQDGQTVLELDESVPYGDNPSFDADEPVKEDSPQYHYTFAGWSTNTEDTTGDPDYALAVVTGDVTYFAAFSWGDRLYTVTWKSQDGSQTLAVYNDMYYGDRPIFHSEVPVKEDTQQYHYYFVGWATSANQTSGDYDVNLPTVAADITYYAAYSETVKTYGVTWYDQDGTLLESDYEVPYGTAPSFDQTDPVKQNTAQYTYAFVGWSQENHQTSGTPEADLPAVTGYTSYYPAFSQTVNTYTVTWMSQDGQTVLETDENVPYGTAPSFNLTDPVKENTAQYTFEFVGWADSADSTIGMMAADLWNIEGDTVYYAAFSQIVNSYRICFLNAEGIQIMGSVLDYGETPVFTQSPPGKAEDAMYTYDFAGWSPEIGPVTQDVDYVPVFTPTLKTYEVSFYANGGEGNMDSVTPNAGAYVLPENGFTAPANHYFAGWALNDPAGDVYLAGSEYTLLSDSVFYALWVDHQHVYVPIPAVEPTCTETGLTEGQRCSVCGQIVVEQRVVDELGHDYQSVVTEPTCTDGGFTTHTCQRCGHSYTDAETSSLGHHYADTVTAPTCTEGGFTTHVCDRCGDTYTDTATAATGHTWASAEYSWSADGKTCVVIVVCGTDGARETVADVVVGSSVKTAAAVGSMGVTTYSVSGTFGGYAYSSSMDVTDIPALEPEIVLKESEGTSTYTNTVAANQATQMTGIFNTAKSNSGEVEVSVATSATSASLTIAFDAAAVGSIGGNEVTLSATVSESTDEVKDAELVIEVSLVGATFSDGKAKVSVPLSQSVPAGKVVKVYFINGGERTDMNATLVDGLIVFETNHFSTYAVFFEDEPSSGSNGGGFPITLVIGGVAIVALAGGAAFFLLRKH